MKKFKFKKISIVVLAVVFTLSIVGIVKAIAPITSPDLGTASSFSILAKTLVSSSPTSSIEGDVGLDNAGSSYAGLTSAEVTGTIYDTNGTGPDAGLGNNPTLMTTARAANNTAFLALSATPNDLCGNSINANGSSGTISDGINFGAVTTDLAGKTLVPGIYCSNAFTLSGTLTLDDSGSANGVWIFRSAASLVTSTGSSVVFHDNVASPCNVWWKVVSSATIGSGTNFIGNILASTSISMGTGATLAGRLFAYTGAVTLLSNTISGSCAAPNTNVNPKLTLNKIVVGGSSAESAWTLTAAGPMTLSGPGAAGSTDVVGNVPVGTYNLSESIGPSRYTASSWSCTLNGGDAVVGDSIALVANDTAVCTITNTYHAPSSSGSSVMPIITYAPIVFNPAINIIGTPVIPKLPKTGFPPQESGTWYESLLNNILNLFR